APRCLVPAAAARRAHELPRQGPALRRRLLALRQRRRARRRRHAALRLRMRYARAELLQWVGLLGGAVIWTAQLVVGLGATLADCNPASSRFGIALDTWEISLMAAAGALVLIAEGAAVSVLLETRDVEESDP